MWNVQTKVIPLISRGTITVSDPEGTVWQEEFIQSENIQLH